VFIEAFVDAPGGAINFDNAFGDRFQKVLKRSGHPQYRGRNGNQNRRSLTVRLGQSIPNVNLDSGGKFAPGLESSVEFSAHLKPLPAEAGRIDSRVMISTHRARAARRRTVSGSF
jgi:hypothetical protein